MIMVSSAAGEHEGRQPVAVVVTVAKGYDLGYVWKNQGQAAAEPSTGGYYISAAQSGEPPGQWWGPAAAALGLAEGEIVERKSHDAIYEQIDPRTGAKLGRPRGSYPKFTDHLARLRAAEPHATAGRLIGGKRAAAYWAGREERFQESLHRANRAALEYAQRWAGVTRTGYHGTQVDGRAMGRFEQA